MPNVAQHIRLQQLCSCRVKFNLHQKKKKTKEFCKRKRQVFVYNPEEEILYEPYMRTLRHEFSDESVSCDSKIELSGKDFALPTGMTIRPDVTSTAEREAEVKAKVKSLPVEAEKGMTLPWKDLVITETLQSTLEDPEACDSSVEIPWGDLALERPMVIRPPREDETCVPDDVEIPWDEIRVSQNIVIKPEKRRKHPSSGQPPCTRADLICISCDAHPSSEKTRPGTSNWTATCM